MNSHTYSTLISTSSNIYFSFNCFLLYHPLYSSICCVNHASGQSDCGQYHIVLVPTRPAQWSHFGLWAAILWEGNKSSNTNTLKIVQLFSQIIETFNENQLRWTLINPLKHFLGDKCVIFLYKLKLRSIKCGIRAQATWSACDFNLIKN